MHWTEVDTPALLVDLDRLETNIARMADRARSAGVELRPHFKTHKSVEIAAMQRDAGVVGFSVASLDEAQVLIDAGFDDILLATQIVTPEKVNRALGLPALLVLAVDSPDGLKLLSAMAHERRRTAEVAIEINSGLNRCGVLPSEAGRLAEIAGNLPGIELRGVFTHGGHGYRGPDRAGVRQALFDEIDSVEGAAESIRKFGIEVSTRSIGSTPTVLSDDDYRTATEIRPGNYVFRDAMQVGLGVAEPSTCALTVSATVISRPTADRAIIDAGSKTLALDRGGHGFEAISDYGQDIGGAGFLRSLSEEHGFLAIPADSRIRVGDRVRILPNHACTVANLARHYHGVRGDHLERMIAIDGAAGSR